MSNPNQKLRYALGVSALTALSLAMIGCGGSSSSTPVAVNAAPGSVTISGANTAVQYHASLYNLSAVDPEGDAITYTATTTNGTATIPAGTSVLTFTPATVAGASAPAIISVIATDSKGAASAAKTIAVVVTPNTPAHFTSTPPTAPLVVGQTLTYTPVCELDPEHDTITITKTSTAGSYTSGGAFTYTPTLADVGPVTVTFSATDGFTGGSATQTFTFTVVSNNTKPNITTSFIPDVHLNHDISLQLNATDDGVGGPALVWTITSQSPAGGYSLTTGGLLASTAALIGGHTVTVRVTDAGGLYDEKTYTNQFVEDGKPNFQAGLLPTEVVAGTGAMSNGVTNLVNYFDQSLVRGLAPGNSLSATGFVVASPNADYITPQALNDQGKTSLDVLANPASNASLVIAQANDAEGDKVRFSITSNSVFRGGVPKPAADIDYPSVQQDDKAEISLITNQSKKAGTMLWTPLVGETDGDGTAFVLPAADNVGTVANPLFYTYKMKLQQLIGTVPTPGQVVDTNTISVKAERNNTPELGPLDKIYGSIISHGVYTGGGSHVAAPHIGRPALQEPNTPDTLASAGLLPASWWIWNVLPPSAGYNPLDYTGVDAVIRDPNSINREGHQDAIALSMPASGFPVWDTTPIIDKPTIDLPASIANLFYNPWTNTAANPGNLQVDWAPVREQYMKGRYIGTVSYTFKPTVVDQYNLASERVINVTPIFGLVKMANSRFYNEADGTENFFIRGDYTDDSNGRAAGSNDRYLFRYLPAGLSTEATAREWADPATTLTYGSFLFGRPSDNAGAIASGYAGGFPFSGGPGLQGVPLALTLPPYGTNTDQTAGFWVEHDSPSVSTYGSNPLNQKLNPASTALGVPGTAGASDTINYVAGGYLSPYTALGITTVNISGDYADNAAMAELVPSNTYYHFSQRSITSPTDTMRGWQTVGNALGAPGTDSPIQLNVPYQWGLWYQGKYQSEVDYSQAIPGRAVYFSTSPKSALLADTRPTMDQLGTLAANGYRARLRFNYTWPSNVANSATLFGITAPTANTFAALDVMQIATPNLSGNARFFFTGNDVGGIFGGLGIPTPAAVSGAGTYIGWLDGNGHISTGVFVANTWPLHAATNSIWIPNGNTSWSGGPAATKFKLDGAYNWPNIATVATGSVATDVPFTGIKGFVDSGNGVGGGIGGPSWNQTPAALARLVDKTLAFRVANNTTGNVAQPGEINTYDNVANPALLDLNSNDRTVFLWMKPTIAGTPGVGTAYASYGGSVLSKDATWTQTGGKTTVTPANDPITGLAMNDTTGVTGLTDIGAQIIFSDGGAGSNNQAPNQGWGIGAWGRNLYYQYKDEVAATNQPGQPSRAKVAIPLLAADYNLSTELQANSFFAQAGGGSWGVSVDNADGVLKDGITVYGVRKHAGHNVGFAGIEPGSPVLATWYNLGNTSADIGAVTAPAGQFFSPLSTTEFAHVVEAKVNFIGVMVHPALWNVPVGVIPTTAMITANANLVAKEVLSMGFQAETSDTATIAAAALRPLLTPIKQLRINDMVLNTADGNYTTGTTLDIANGTTNDPTLGAPLGNYPNWRLYLDGNNQGVDYRIHGGSNTRLRFQVPTTDPRGDQVSGFIVTVYRIDNDPNAALNPLGLINSHKVQVAEYRFGYDNRDIWQNLYLPSFRNMDDSIPLSALTVGGAFNKNAFYAIKVRSVWMKDSVTGNRIDMEKTPFAQGIPMAWADFLSGVFAVRYRG